MTKFVVTGGAGFIGSHIVEELLKYNYKVIVIDNLLEGRLENLAHVIDRIDFRKADIPSPPLAEQDRIANILSTIYQKATLERTEKLRLERIKACLMDLLLTGKIRVKVD